MLKVISAKVRKNAPGVWCRYDLEIVCPELDLPERRMGLVYDKKTIDFGQGKPTNLYFAEKNGYVSFFAWRGPENEGGFGGSKYHIDVRQPDGTVCEEVLKGPWSSNCSAMASQGFKQAVQVLWQGSICGNITLEFARQILRDFNLPYEYRPIRENDPYTFVLFEV